MDEQEKKLMEKYGKLPMKKNMLSGMKVSPGAVQFDLELHIRANRWTNGGFDWECVL
jgi:hypothetical protein